MPGTIHEASGVTWRYLPADEHHPYAETCAGCDRRFVASVHYHAPAADGGGHYCPGCHPVASLRHELAAALAAAETPPASADVAALMDGGDPR